MTWKRKRLGPMHLHGIQRRQIRVGRPSEPVAVIKILEDIKSGEEVILTSRDLRFLTIGMEYERDKWQRH